VEVRVERLRLAELVGDVGLFSGDANTILEGYKKDLELLDRRVSIIQEMDETTGTLESLQAKTRNAPARVLDDIQQELDSAADTLKLPMPEEVDLRAAQEAIRSAAERLKKSADEDLELAGKLANSVGELQDVYKQGGDIDKIRKCKDLRDKTKGLFDPLINKDYAKKAKVLPRHYHWLSSVIERLYVLRHYVRVWDSADVKRRVRIESLEEPLLQCLKLRTHNALNRARQIRREIEEDILPDTIEKELSSKAFSIHTVPIQPSANQPVSLEIRFKRKDLNTCTARQEFTCVWDFDAIGKEEGWAIWHYFRNPAEASFSVSFLDPDGEPIKGNAGKEVTKQHSIQLRGDTKKHRSERKYIEATWFLVAFGVAILGLFAGAKDELMKLDIVPALVAIFLIGFGADAVKNLIIKRPQGNG
jgi:hypothetical protein